MMSYTYSKPYLFNIEFKAHTHKIKIPESLQEHSDSILECSFSIIENCGLMNIIDNLCEKIYPKNKEAIKDLFFGAIYLHDFGKINPFFQKYKMDNIVSSYTEISKKINENEINHTGHSALSVLYYLDYYLKKYEIEGDDMDSIILAFSNNIIKHHASYLDNLDNYISKNIEVYYDFFNFEIINKKNIDLIISKSSQVDNDYLWYLLRLNFGLLTKSDFLSTSKYINGYNHNESVIDVKLKDKIKNKFWYSENFANGEKNYNSNFLINSLSYNNSFETVRNKDNMNYMRNLMFSESLHNYNINPNKNIFYLECPTGGGKSNISLGLISKMVQDLNVKKVHYVLPFNKITEQIEVVIKNTFHLKNDEINAFSYDSFKEILEDENISNYEKDKINMNNNIFMNYPFLLMSHVKFFDLIKSNKKSDIYNMTHLANSIVVLDEIQAYNPYIWSKIVYFIDTYSEIFNMKFIIMSATLPKIDKLVKNENNKFHNLINNRDKYFLNINFKDRVKINGDLMNYGDISYEIIKKEIIEKSEIYYKKYNQCHTVLEFIYKKNASEFVKKYRNELEKYGYEVMLLSSITLKPKQKSIIKKIKSGNYKKIILVCTQCIEAGVDIDMDLGFKDISIFDSEEQLAGRINRNASKQENVLYLFNMSKKRIYYDDMRYKSIDYGEEYLDILNNKNFDVLYNKIIDKLNKEDKYTTNISLKPYLKNINKCSHEKIENDLSIIDSNPANKQIYIPLTIPFKDIENEENLPKHLLNKDGLCGVKVWEEYIRIISNIKNNFIELKRHQKYVSMFSVNLFLSIKNYGKMLSYLSVVNDTHYLNDIKLYDYEDGFDLSYIDDSLTN